MLSRRQAIVYLACCLTKPIMQKLGLAVVKNVVTGGGRRIKRHGRKGLGEGIKENLSRERIVILQKLD